MKILLFMVNVALATRIESQNQEMIINIISRERGIQRFLKNDSQKLERSLLSSRFDPMEKITEFPLRLRELDGYYSRFDKGVSILDFLLAYMASFKSPGNLPYSAKFLDMVFNRIPPINESKMLPCEYILTQENNLLSPQELAGAMTNFYASLSYSAFRRTKKYDTCLPFLRKNPQFYPVLGAYFKNLAQYDPEAISMVEKLRTISYKDLPKLYKESRYKKDFLQAAFYVEAAGMVEKLDSISAIKEFITTAKELGLILNISHAFHEKIQTLALPQSPGLLKFKSLAQKVVMLQRGINRKLKVDPSLVIPAPAKDFYTLMSDNIKLSVLSLEEINYLFSLLAREKSIDFKEITGGCQHRAQDMSTILDRMGVKNAKIFTIGGNMMAAHIKVDAKNYQNLDDLGVNGNYVSWWFHVAPMVLVKVEDEILPFVLDPSLHQSPVPVQVWLERQKVVKTSKIFSVKVYSRNRKDPFGDLAADKCFPQD